MSVRIDDFTILLLVEAARNFSRAAEIRHTTQQAISTRIKKLEHEFGLPLFERSNQGVRLTEGGRRLLPYARRWVALYEETVDAARADSVVASLRVRAEEAVRPVLEALPLELEYLQVTPGELLARLERGDIDLALGTFHELPPSLAAEEVITDSLALVVPPEHPLAGRTPLSRDDLGGHPISMEPWVHRHTRKHGRHDEVEGEEILAAPGSIVASELDTGTLVELEIVDMPTWKIRVQAAYRSDDPDIETISLAIKALSNAEIHQP